ncbi:unnamed protein product [Rhizophagus irregularis]|uniref:Uncharacterized protein n=1 Tax=Rhizophagus irregularis TaxID=588596 RepID=A0A2I1HP26_9GLOM|nr:hypothetical protein RhiirA4_484499 [Rhizophagus irregularis]CAB4418267.1 unnamed protein product [Rhizophagus irregularis]
MVSSNTVIIDWSATPTSFARADAYTRTPVADLYNHTPSHTSLNVLTTKDILTYDIDIYLKFYKRSLPSDETLSLQNSLDENDIPLSPDIPIISSSDHDAPDDIIPDITPTITVDDNTVLDTVVTLKDTISPPIVDTSSTEIASSPTFSFLAFKKFLF